jgi:hypothetical protein
MAVQVPDAVMRALRTVARHADRLPDELEEGRVFTVADPTGDRDGEDLRALVGVGPDGALYLDYFRAGPSSSRHGRIHADGRFEKLENYEGQFGTRVLATPAETERERQRVAAHNAAVRAHLRAKGFED